MDPRRRTARSSTRPAESGQMPDLGIWRTADRRGTLDHGEVAPGRRSPRIYGRGHSQRRCDCRLRHRPATRGLAGRRLPKLAGLRSFTTRPMLRPSTSWLTKSMRCCGRRRPIPSRPQCERGEIARRYPGKPIVVLASFPRPQHAQAWLGRGVREVLSLPVDLELLRAVLVRVLPARNMRTID